jgi:hypothetical protein
MRTREYHGVERERKDDEQLGEKNKQNNDGTCRVFLTLLTSFEGKSIGEKSGKSCYKKVVGGDELVTHPVGVSGDDE